MPTRIQIRRGTATEWASQNTVLAEGEPGHAFDTDVLAIGDGTSAWNDLPKFRPSADPVILRSIAATTGIGATITDLTGLGGLTFTVGAQPWIVELYLPWVAMAAGNSATVYIRKTDNTAVAQAPAAWAPGNVGIGRVRKVIDTPGVYNFKASMNLLAGTGTVASGANLDVLEAIFSAKPFVQ